MNKNESFLSPISATRKLNYKNAVGEAKDHREATPRVNNSAKKEIKGVDDGSSHALSKARRDKDDDDSSVFVPPLRIPSNNLKVPSIQWVDIYLPGGSFSTVAVPDDEKDYLDLLAGAFDVTSKNIVGLRDLNSQRVMTLAHVCYMARNAMFSDPYVSKSFELLVKASSDEVFTVSNTGEELSAALEKATDLEVLKSDLLAFIRGIISSKEDCMDYDEFAEGGLEISPVYADVLQGLVNEGDGVVIAAMEVASFCDDEDYLRCQLCTIAHNKLREDHLLEREFESSCNIVTHHELEHLIDLAGVIDENVVLEDEGSYVALLHSILIRDDVIIDAYNTFKKSSSHPRKANDMLIKTLHEITLNIDPVKYGESLMLSVKQKAEEDLDLYYEVVSSTCKLLIEEGRLSKDDWYIVCRLLILRDEVMIGATDIYLEDMNIEDFKSLLVLRVVSSRTGPTIPTCCTDGSIKPNAITVCDAGSDSNVTEIIIDIPRALSTALEILVEKKSIEPQAAAALRISYMKGNKVVHKVYKVFEENGDAHMLLNMLESLVRPIELEAPPKEESFSIADELPLLELLSDTISTLLSTELVTKVDAMRLYDLARQGSSDLFDLLRVAYSSKGEMYIVDQFLNGLLRLGKGNESENNIEINDSSTNGVYEANKENIDPLKNEEDLLDKTLINDDRDDGENKFKSNSTIKSSLKSYDNNEKNDEENDDSKLSYLPQAVAGTDYENQTMRIVSNCIDLLVEREMITEEDAYALFYLGRRNDDLLLAAIETFHADGDMSELLENLVAVAHNLQGGPSSALNKSQKIPNDSIATVDIDNVSSYNEGDLESASKTFDSESELSREQPRERAYAVDAVAQIAGNFVQDIMDYDEFRLTDVLTIENITENTPFAELIKYMSDVKLLSAQETEAISSLYEMEQPLCCAAYLVCLEMLQAAGEYLPARVAALNQFSLILKQIYSCETTTTDFDRANDEMHCFPKLSLVNMKTFLQSLVLSGLLNSSEVDILNDLAEKDNVEMEGEFNQYYESRNLTILISNLQLIAIKYQNMMSNNYKPDSLLVVEGKAMSIVPGSYMEEKKMTDQFVASIDKWGLSTAEVAAVQYCIENKDPRLLNALELFGVDRDCDEMKEKVKLIANSVSGSSNSLSCPAYAAAEDDLFGRGDESASHDIVTV